MFGKKIKQKPVIAEPEKEEPVITPCEDEPNEWAQLTEPQLAETWYRLESLSIGDEKKPQINDQDNFRWYLNAANQGDRCAQYALGKMFQRGVLTHAVLFQAGLWYSKASNAGSPFADYELAKMCEYGITMNKDADMADKLYRKAGQAFVAIENSIPNRAVEKKLAALCDKGVFVDPQEAAHWKQLAEQQTSPAPPNEELSVESSQVQETRNVEKQSRKKSGCHTDAMCLEDIPVEYIFPAKSNQYAEHDTEQSIHALAMSIQVHGLISPLTVNKISKSEYRIIAGEKRYKAITQFLHWHTISVIVKDNLTPSASQSMLNAANLDVRDYSAGEKLQFYIENERQLRKMKESGKYSGPLQEGIAELLGVSSHQIRKYQRIVEMLPSKRLKQIKDGKLSIEKAYKMTLRSSVDKHPSAADSPKNHTGRTSDFERKADVVEGQKISPISVSEDVPRVLENQAGRTSGFDGKADVVEGQKISPISVPEDAPQAPENQAERTSGFREKADVAEGQKTSLVSVSEDALQVPEILKKSVGRTSGFEEQTGLAEGQKISRIPVSEDVPRVLENPVGRTSGFKEKADVVEEQKISRISVPEDVPETQENHVGRTSEFEKKADVVERQKNSPISVPEDVPQAPENQDGCTFFQEPANYVEAVHLLKNLPVIPGQCCEVLQDEEKLPGVIDRIELYENALIISVLVNNIRRPYPVSKIGTDLILGTNASA